MEKQQPFMSKVLIADDDVALRDSYAAVLRDGGFEVSVVEDGEAAWQLLIGGLRPDLIITGILMPRMGGFDLMRKLLERADFATIPVVISSHRGSADDQKIAQTLGAKDFLVRYETTPGEVLRRIRAILGQRRLLKIAVLANKLDGMEFARILSGQQGAELRLTTSEIIIEVEPGQQRGTFHLRSIV